MGALEGYFILDLSRVLAGPWCSQILADLGADVVKVERPDTGDDTRAWGPPWMVDEEGRQTGEAAYYQSANRGKSSIAIDIATPEGQALIRALAAKADVLIENYKQGTLDRYGLGYDALSELNPRLVYCSITGFGQTGPRAAEPGYDFIIQGMGGLMSITGERDDLPGGGPQKVGVAVADLMTGLYSAIAIEAALLARERTGRGQHIDMALLDVQLATLGNQSQNYLASGRSPPRSGNAHVNIAPYRVFRARDRDFIIACGNDAQFRAMSEAIGLPELADDPRFIRNGDRVLNRAALDEILTAHFVAAEAAHWVDRIHQRKVPVGVINDIEQALAEPQAAARGMVVNVPHTLNPAFEMVASPIKLSDTPVTYGHAAPILGEHSDQVLARYLDIKGERLAELKARGVVQQWKRP